MSITHKQTLSISSTNSTGLSGVDQETGNTEIVQDVSYAASQTNILQAIAFTVASLQSVMLVSDRGLVIKTNSTSAPGNTITLQAGTPLVWGVSPGYFACPFTSSVTAFYITTTVAARLQVKILTS